MKFLKIALSVIVFTSLGSCKKYLDVNDDPNKTDDASVDVVLAGAQASTCIQVGGELFNLGGFWAQYYTQSPDAGQYENMDQYNVTSDFFDRAWQELYAGALRDYQYIKEKSSGDNNSYYLIATLMEAYTYQVLVDLYDQVPYSDDLEGEEGNITPEYDEGRVIYQSLISSIDDAIAMYQNDPSGPEPTTNDIIFGGDMDQWVRFGNTLKLKMLLRMSETPSFDQGAVMSLVNGGQLLNDLAQMTLFESAQNKSNPFYDVNYSRLGGVNHAAAQSIVEYFDANGDARLPEIYEPGGSGQFTTKPQGDFANRDISFDDLAQPIVTATKPIVLFSPAEVQFMIAEAQERWGAGGQSAYEMGIEESFAMYGMADTASFYVGAGGAYEWNTSGSMEDRLKQIWTQKWAAMANSQNLEAFFEINRTGFPEFKSIGNWQPGELQISVASVLPSGQTPRRLLFANVSKSRNPNVPAQPAGGLAAPVWWDQ